MKLTLDLRSYDGALATHSHDYHQLVLPLKGSMEMEINSTSESIVNDKVAIIPANTEHAYSVKGDNRFIVADVPSALSPALAKLPPFIKMDRGLSQYLLFLENELETYISNPTHVGNQRNRQMILLFVQLLTDRFGQVLNVDNRLITASEFIDSRLDRTISLAEIATVANLSVRQLTELFRRYFDMSPKQYLLEQRMQLAWRLLNETSLSVQQVSERCGYTNLSAFSSRFSDHYGLPPTKLRKKTRSIGKQFLSPNKDTRTNRS